MNIKIINHPGGIIQQTDKEIINVFGNVNLDNGENQHIVPTSEGEYTEYTEVVNDVGDRDKADKSEHQSSPTFQKTSKPVVVKKKRRETMTFKRKNSVLDAHLTLLFDKLTKEGWIEGNEADFKALFSGGSDEDCILTWLEPFGRAALFSLFNAFSQDGLIIIPDGFGISSILEGHFKYKTGGWLSGLDKGNKPHSAAVPVILECVKLLKTDLKGYFGNAEESSDVYDSYDHQDMHLHRR